MKRTFLATACILAVYAFGPAARAQPAEDIDRTFVIAVLQGNNAELDMAQLVLERGRMDEALSFARTMLADHAALAARFARVEPSASAPLAERETAADRLALARLAALPPADMDQDYLIDQVAEHLATVSVFGTEAVRGTSPALRAFAKSELPFLKEHLQVALAAARHVSGSNPLR